ncbi:hypothetical protein LZ31DRAFT_1937 [Colletotrichum somersetense]|nr:hypothetical protein LZ31DRAFT_1937 [Colletotrichum somersetense]
MPRAVFPFFLAICSLHTRGCQFLIALQGSAFLWGLYIVHILRSKDSVAHGAKAKRPDHTHPHTHTHTHTHTHIFCLPRKKERILSGGGKVWRGLFVSHYGNNSTLPPRPAMQSSFEEKGKTK